MGGWGGGRGFGGAQNFEASCALPKQQSHVEIEYHGTLFLS